MVNGKTAQQLVGQLSSCSVVVRDADESLTLATRYDYNLTITGTTCSVEGGSIYGAMMGIGTFVSIAVAGAISDDIQVADEPQYTRGAGSGWIMGVWLALGVAHLPSVP